MCFRSPDHDNLLYTRFDQDVEDYLRNVVRDGTGNVVHEFAGSGSGDEGDEDSGVLEDVSLVVPAMDILDPAVRSPLPSYPFSRMKSAPAL